MTKQNHKCKETDCTISTEDFKSIDAGNYGKYCYFHSIGKVIKSFKLPTDQLSPEQFQSVLDVINQTAKSIPDYTSFTNKFIELLKNKECGKISTKGFSLPHESNNLNIKSDDKPINIPIEVSFSDFVFYDYNHVKSLIGGKDINTIRNDVNNILGGQSKTIVLENLQFTQYAQFITNSHNLTFKKCDFEKGLSILAYEKEQKKHDPVNNSVELSNDCTVKEKLEIQTNKLTISNCTISCENVELAVPFGQLTLVNPIYKEYLFKDSELIEIYDGVKGEPSPVNGKPTGSCEHVDMRNILFHDTTLENKQNGYSKQIINNLSKIKFSNCNFNKNHTLYDNNYLDYSNIILDNYLSTNNKFWKISILALGILVISIILWFLATKQWQNAEHNLGLVSSIIALVILVDFVVKKITSIQLISLLIEIILFPILILQDIIMGKPYKSKTRKILDQIITTMEKTYKIVPSIGPKTIISSSLLVILLLIFITTQSLFIFAIVLFIAYIFQTKYLYYDGKNYKTILEKYKNKKNIFKRLEYSYIHLREHYDSNKDYLVANDFHYNYMEAKRRNTQNLLDKLFLLFYGYINGYNTKPERAFGWLIILPIIFTLVFGLGLNWYNLTIQTGIDNKNNKTIVLNVKDEQDLGKKFEYILGYNYRNITFLNILKDSDIYKTNDATTLLLTSSENALALVLITLGIPAFYNRYRRSKSDGGGEAK